MLNRLTRGALCSSDSTRVILGMLSGQQDRSMIGRFLPPDWSYAGKTGADADLRTDVGLVRNPSEREYLVAMYCKTPASDDWSVDHPGVLALANLSRFLLKTAS
jgi:beta-lactamase class A